MHFFAKYCIFQYGLYMSALYDCTGPLLVTRSQLGVCDFAPDDTQQFTCCMMLDGFREAWKQHSPDKITAACHHPSFMMVQSAAIRSCMAQETWHVQLVQELQAENHKALREAQLQAEEQLAEAHRQALQLREEHQAALRDAEQASEARGAEAAKQAQHVREEHQRAVRCPSCPPCTGTTTLRM